MVKAFLQVLGSCTGDTNGNVLIFFDEMRYLFECGDGTQRFCNANRVRMSNDKLRHIFISRLVPNSMGGLLGMLLTMADAGKDKLKITAPNGFQRILAASRSFYFRPKFELEILEVAMGVPGWTGVCQDENMKVLALTILGASSPVAQEPSEMENDGTGAKAKRMRSGRQAVSLCFECRINDLPGRFNPESARALGIPKGPLYAKLVRGEEIEVDGRVVKPEQVISPGTPGPVVWILNVPSTDFIASLVQHPCQDLRGDTLVALVHMCPLEVLRDDRYKVWSQSFGDAIHILLHASIAIPRNAFRANADNIIRLSKVVGDRLFPVDQNGLGLIIRSRAEELEAVGSDVLPSGLEFVGQVVLGEPLLKCGLAPRGKTGLDASETVEQGFDIQALNREIASNKAVVDSHDHVRKMNNYLRSRGSVTEESKKPSFLSSIDRKTAEVVFLGTGAALPSPYRNVSSILLNLFDRGCILIDAGEGTYGQLVRCYGAKHADELVLKMKAIWISHMHADHHLGTTGILSRRAELGADSPLLIVGPCLLDEWLTSFSRFGNDSFRYLFFDNSDLVVPQQPQAHYFEQTLGLRFEAVDVVHCPFAYGLVIEDCINEWKLVYSGDTRPCRKLAERGSGATLAIHEATLGNDMGKEAFEKFHSTTREALGVCRTMKAYRTVLTHFSQRYRVPAFFDCEEIARSNAAIAYDFMTLNFADLEMLPEFMEGLVSLYTVEAIGDAMGEGLEEVHCEHAVGATR